MKIVFPESNHPLIQQALTEYSARLSSSQPSLLSGSSLAPIEALPAPDLATACTLVKSGTADTMIAGIDYSSRDVILACREHFGMAKQPQLVTPEQVQPNSAPDNFTKSELYSTFSGLAVMQKTNSLTSADQTQKPDQPISNVARQTYLLADMAACKHPTPEQLHEIILQTITSARSILSDIPRVALLSFSTFGSGGRDDTITLLQDTLAQLQSYASPDTFLIDGEMQLDAALNPRIGAKKFPDSPVAGQANVLIAPDLNAGNILYKSFEQIGGFTVAGPILQGFNFPVSDLSRGSTITDILLTIETMTKLTSPTK